MSETPYDGSAPEESVALDTRRAHGARIYDYILGGKDNYPVDRKAGDASIEVWPALRVHMQANRAFMHRVGRFLAAERGIRQFLDIGTGIPTQPNLHEIVQEVAPDAHIVYVDNDPIVLAHAQARLKGTRQGRTSYIHADMRHPQETLDAPELRTTIDLGHPVAVSIIAVLQFVLDDAEAYDLVAEYMRPMPSGSYLALSTVTVDSTPTIKNVVNEYTTRGIPARERTKSEVERFFDGLELVDPGVTLVNRWRPGPAERKIKDSEVAMYGGVARKP
jgi:S-adenosyl methyltransferase